MKIVYITPTIQDEGGLSRVFSLKANYFVEKLGFEVFFLTLNNHSKPFFSFNPSVKIIDLKTHGNKLERTIQYFKNVNSFISNEKPDVLILCDLGWKGLFFNFFVKTKTPLIYEIHGSLYNEPIKRNWLLKKISVKLRKRLVNSFKNIVLLTEDSKKEWGLDCEVIPNPISFVSPEKSTCENKIVLAISRHSYEKGIDRLIAIWAKTHHKFPEWELKIFGDGYLRHENEALLRKYNLEKTIHFFNPVKDILKEYLNASIYVMTSRTEGYPMVLLEAIETGLPIIAYDCPIGPRSLVKNEFNGYLIPDGNEEMFVEFLEKLMKDESLRKEMGKNSSSFPLSITTENIMNRWVELFYKVK